MCRADGVVGLLAWMVWVVCLFGWHSIINVIVIVEILSREKKFVYLRNKNEKMLHIDLNSDLKE